MCFKNCHVYIHNNIIYPRLRCLFGDFKNAIFMIIIAWCKVPVGVPLIWAAFKLEKWKMVIFLHLTSTQTDNYQLGNKSNYSYNSCSRQSTTTNELINCNLSNNWPGWSMQFKSARWSTQLITLIAKNYETHNYARLHPSHEYLFQVIQKTYSDFVKQIK